MTSSPQLENVMHPAPLSSPYGTSLVLTPSPRGSFQFSLLQVFIFNLLYFTIMDMLTGLI